MSGVALSGNSTGCMPAVRGRGHLRMRFRIRVRVPARVRIRALVPSTAALRPR